MEISTVIYYSSGREKPDFEERVKVNILKVTNLPIVSVTQHPINFGTNICVGDVGVSGFNMFRQVLIACKAAQTKFVISAEADCLYPPDYFTYIPERDDVAYRDTNLYVMPDARAYFFKKSEGATHAQIVNREFYIQTLEKLFEGAPMWNPDEKNFPRERHHKVDVFDKAELFETVNPVVQIKTHKGMRYYTHSDRTPINDIPYWGNGVMFRNKYLHGKETV